MSERRHGPDEGAPASLDPADWSEFRATAHKVLDEVIDYLADVRSRPPWQPVPTEIKEWLRAPLNESSRDLESVCREISANILPYPSGNIHPRFFGWVQGGGTADGLIDAMYQAAMNVNVGGRDHVAVYVERQVVDWFRSLCDLPEGTSGLLVTGTSMATLIALAVARQRHPAEHRHRLRFYASSEVHVSVSKALTLLGFDDGALARIDVEPDLSMSVADLQTHVARDRATGAIPCAVIGTAGTASTGAIDDLSRIADVCEAHALWFHVDAAIGIATRFHPELRALTVGIERADSVAFDCHKWLQVQYDAGCLLVRDGTAHLAAFRTPGNYLTRSARGISAGQPWFCDLGPELSRGFRALRVWLTLSRHGSAEIGRLVHASHLLARHLAELVLARADLELLAPVSLATVCFRCTLPAAEPAEIDELNREIVTRLQERGIAVPSLTSVGGKLAIRVNIMNHRTTRSDVVELLRSVVEMRDELVGSR